MGDHSGKDTPRSVGESKDDTSGKRAGKENTGRWSYEEHRLFLKGLEMHGKGWKKIAELIKTRTVVQIRTHAQKYFQKLAKAKQGGGEPGAVLLDRGLGRRNGKRKSGSMEGTAVAPSLQPYMTLPGVNGSVESGLYKFLSPNVITSYVDDEKSAVNADEKSSSSDGVTPAEAVKLGYAPTPDWYARGNNVDVLLNEAEELDWLADSGGANGESEEESKATLQSGGRSSSSKKQAKLSAQAPGNGHSNGHAAMHRSVSQPEGFSYGSTTFGAEEVNNTLDELLGQRSMSLGDLPTDEEDIIIGTSLGIDDEDDGEPPGFDDEAAMDILDDILHRDPLAHLDADVSDGMEMDAMHMEKVDFAREIESMGSPSGAKAPAGPSGVVKPEDPSSMQLDFDELGML
mmetsp:Transcript_14075/g.52821  ORF Transcript_14075/g.52821 Transcript_14075/m.52821 type:complete len:401 (-) Transcript_14075:2417-3619(-)|eukprot:scaffold1741_cov262-Pinguiococcus_pyrenoidosus.AAC.31